ncbi:hypothetical protein [Ammoniphilus sp. YIM 78166]|nr:hypothetical protein [Ammoniphilus sp. YIM 78166]
MKKKNGVRYRAFASRLGVPSHFRALQPCFWAIPHLDWALVNLLV